VEASKKSLIGTRNRLLEMNKNLGLEIPPNLVDTIYQVIDACFLSLLVELILMVLRILMRWQPHLMTSSARSSRCAHPPTNDLSQCL